MTPDTADLTEAEQQALHRASQAIRQHTAPLLAGLAGDQAVLHFITRLHQGVDAVVQAATQAGAKDSVQTACAAGCAYCCQAPVEVTPAEVFLITDALFTQAQAAGAPSLQALTQRLHAHAAALAQAGPDAALKDRPPCPFLVDRLCSIYALRPAVCRKAHSLDVTACATFARVIPQSLQIVLAAEAWIQGTTAAYADQGLETPRVELAGAVLQALTDVSAQARWLDGEAALAP